MNLIPLGKGFAKVLAEHNIVVYFYRGKKIPNEVLLALVDKDAPTDADAFTCEMAGL